MLETLKRINLGMVSEAFRIADITPARYRMHQCVLAAFSYPDAYTRATLINKGFSNEYICGVMKGWDYPEDQRWSDVDHNDIRYKIGVADGKQAAIIMGV